MNQAIKQKPTGTKPRSAAEEQFIADLEKYLGRKLTDKEQNMAVAQAEQIGEL